MHPHYVSLVAGLALANLTSAQDRVPVEEPARSTTVTPVDEPGLPTAGEFVEHPLNDLSDGVPLPETVEGTPGAEADAPGSTSGDPYFLDFAGGKHYPPENEVIDPLLLRNAGAAYDAGRPVEETFAFVMFQKRITPERRAALEAAGARVLGFHPHYTLRVALPPTSIETVASLNFVRWIGAARDEQKVHPALAAQLAAAPGRNHEVFVNVFDSDLGPNATYTPVGSVSEVDPEGQPRAGENDSTICHSNGWQQVAMEELGVTVGEYVDSTRTFRCTLHATQVAMLTQLDHVQFVEPVPNMRLHHDESIPMVGADRSRSVYDGGTNDRAVVGIVDSGILHSHSGLNHTWGIGWSYVNSGSPWADGCEHGSHVMGTMLCLPTSSNLGMTGMAPQAAGASDRRFHSVRLFEDNCDYGTASFSTVMGRFDDPYTDGNGIQTPIPHVVNQSWGSDPIVGGWFGSEFSARLVDDQVRDLGQMHVFSMGNDGSGASTMSVQAAAKNATSVGNVITSYSAFDGDPGFIRGSSSRGPCGDGRWKPTLCAPGTNIDSVDAGDVLGYTRKTGTSMAAPHVTGLVAQMIDSWGFNEYRPALTTALMLAGAVSKDNQVIDNASGDAAHLNDYGVGRIEATRSIFNYGGQSEAYGWHWLWDGSSWLSDEITVGANATRMTVVMVYHEESSSAGAGQALVNDLDLWVDRAPYSAGGNSGEYFAHQSSINNVEVRMIENPTAADYRLKIYPDSFPGSEIVKVGMAVIVTYGDTTPAVSLNVSADKTYAQVGEDVDISAFAWNPGAVASAVFLDSNASGDTLQSSSTTLIDGIVTDLMDNQTLGNDMLLGNIRHSSSRTGNWTTQWNSEGVKTFDVEARGDNMATVSDSVQVIVDSTGPSGPFNVDSSTHTSGVGTCEEDFTVTWNAATDSLSGLAGYRVIFTNFAGTIPNGPLNVGPGSTQYNTTIAATGTPFWAHIRALDNAGNWGTAQHIGPFVISGGNWTKYCSGNVNSTGTFARMDVITGPCLPTNRLTFHVHQMPANQFGQMIMSQSQNFVPFFGGSQGNLCLGAPLFRFSQYVEFSGAAGEVNFSVPFGNLPQGQVISAGETWNWQFWFRDIGGTSNTSEAIEVEFF